MIRLSWKLAGAGALVLLLRGAHAGVPDQGHPLQSLDLIHESYFIATKANRGMVHRLDWTQAFARFSDQWMLVLTSDQYINGGLLDENYLQYETTSSVIRVGRLRNGVGLGTWSDLLYNVASRLPVVRFMPLLDKYSLLNFTAGAEARYYQKGWEFQIASGDANLDNRQVYARTNNLSQGRIQAPVGMALVAVSVANVKSGPLGQGGQVFGADYRWHEGWWSSRGEYDAGHGPGKTGRGYYTDLSYRIRHDWRPELGIRQEEYQWGAFGTHLMTAGIRVAPTKNLAFNLNYGFDSPIKLLSGSYSVPYYGYNYGATLDGWSFQTMFTFRFQS
jgi:hypothetical protein